VSVVAIIPARSGSKGLTHKNLACIGGKTLLELAVILGKDANCIDDVYISTDSPEYAEIAIAAGACFRGLRPARLAKDDAKTIDVVTDLLGTLGKSYEYVVLLQPTSPIRFPADVNAAFATLDKHGADAVVSVEMLEEPHPEKVKRISPDGTLYPYISGASSETPRQKLPKAYRLNGAIYVIRTKTLLEQRTFLPTNTAAYQMPKGINIDSEEDFILLQTLFEMGRVSIHGAARASVAPPVNGLER
jgi:CMP-N-acetylneuraminic acid synthetase